MFLKDLIKNNVTLLIFYRQRRIGQNLTYIKDVRSHLIYVKMYSQNPFFPFRLMAVDGASRTYLHIWFVTIKQSSNEFYPTYVVEQFYDFPWIF